MQVNGISLNVAEHGAGVPVILLHGWPDSGYLWRHQVPYLVDHGFRVVVPDLRGFGQSERPAGVAAYSLPTIIADVAGILDELGIQTAHVVGHDWGAAVAWFTAMLIPDRVRRLVVLSVPHPLAPATLRQREMAWYQLLFQFEGIAEAQLQANDWALFRTFSRGDGDQQRYLADLSRPGALTASLNWYRAGSGTVATSLAEVAPAPEDRTAVPLRVLWPEHDPLFPPAWGDRLEEFFADVSVRPLAGVGHFVPLEAPGAFAGAIADALA